MEQSVWRAATSLQLRAGAQPGMKLEELRQAGVCCIELAWRHEQLDMLDPANARKVGGLIESARALGIEVWSLHLPYGTLWDVSALDSAVRETAIVNHLRLLGLARQWGIGIAVLHPSWEPIAGEERGERLRACKRSLAVLAHESGRLDVRVAVECLPRTCLGHTAEEMAFLLDADERLGICCDVNHLLKESPEAFIRRLGSRIITVHMSDNDGMDERHWLPGQGIIRWHDVLAALTLHNYRGPFMFEARPVEPFQLAQCWRELMADRQTRGSQDAALVAVTDQASGRILAFDPRRTDSADACRPKWAWSPDASNGFEHLLGGWGLPTDAKIRSAERLDGQWMVVTDSRGLAAIVPYPAGNTRKWGLIVGGNPHSAELLPGGNIAVAASTAGWVRLYAASQGPDCADYTEYRLPGAHGVQWDPQLRLLWAIGDHELVALAVEGTESSPQLREADRAALPTGGGHDLQPVYGDNDRLWVSTREHVYRYSKSARAFEEAHAVGPADRLANVKSIGNFRSGLAIFTAPDGKIRPEAGHRDNDWCTDRAEQLGDADAPFLALPGAAIYKVRVWYSDYA